MEDARDAFDTDRFTAFENEDYLIRENGSGKNDLPLLLIVEDNSDVREYLCSLLESEYTIELADNGKVGLDKALTLVPDIILSDVMMPGTGWRMPCWNGLRMIYVPVIFL